MEGHEKTGAEIHAPEAHPNGDISPAERVTRRGGVDSAPTQGGEPPPVPTRDYAAYLRREAVGIPQPPRFADGFPEEAKWLDVEALASDPELPEAQPVTPDPEPYDAGAHELEEGKAEPEGPELEEGKAEPEGPELEPEAVGSPESDEATDPGAGVSDPEAEPEEGAGVVYISIAEVGELETWAAQLREIALALSLGVRGLSQRVERSDVEEDPA